MDISQLIVKKRKIEHSNVDKLQPLKEAALIGFDSIISRITKSQTEIKLATSEEQLQSLSKQFHDINSVDFFFLSFFSKFNFFFFEF